MSTVQTSRKSQSASTFQAPSPDIQLGALIKSLQAENGPSQIDRNAFASLPPELQDFYHQGLKNQFERVSKCVNNFIQQKNEFDYSERNTYFRDRSQQQRQESDRPWNPPLARKKSACKQNGTRKPHQILNHVSTKRTHIPWITKDGAFAGEVIKVKATARANTDPEHAKTALTALFGLTNALGIHEDHNIGIVNRAEDGTLSMYIVPSIEPLPQEQSL